MTRASEPAGRRRSASPRLRSTPSRATCVRHHHERWDGDGYPAALAGTAIPDGAQILALAGASDAMTTALPLPPGAQPP
jgi:response regulator RpfG family c-di-GMP phosphodiesterase